MKKILQILIFALCLSFGINAFAYCTQEQTIGYAQDTISADTNGVEDYNTALFCADKVKAAEHFAKAAQAGHTKAQYNLAVCYQKAYGVNHSAQEAVKWYQKAAEKGFAKAQNNLGTCYFKGDGVEKDYQKAAYWYGKAASQGNAKAQDNLQKLKKYGYVK
jgi:FOG: TPR repeat, SEL1 subfamily